MDLGNRIKTEREKLNMSQDELAQKMDISRQAISKWETGSSYPDIEKILKLSEIFNLSLDELVKGDKNLQENLIKEGKANMSGLTILGYILIALGVITCIWGGGQYPVNLMTPNFMSYLVGGLFLLTIGIAVIHKVPSWLILGAIFVTGAATILYMIGLKMPIYALLSGIVVILGLVLWLTTLVLKSNFYTK
ncbi:helix-turn-helix domain-containing protein [Desulfoscipio gibsoniae]|uniref:Putative transcription factor, MBF1 like protein n=1 Tax=Desulfoscipio gibsoniae DSM 7213 TaxID=767817 RepID=R4KMN3_9FIRM|nr:helix-turn-helix transcriptional regulator [Desulfoscipio gibsoniae]AGL02822.1 putative transcription factor, MBF1 like protein [Desulfoscipio gibsoniae DSM 7213]